MMHASTCTIQSNFKFVTKSIWAGVRFGTPGKNCSGSGICQVLQLNDSWEENNKCKCKQATWIIARSSYCLEFRFLNREMAECTRLKYFKNDYFLIEEDVVLPLFLRRALGLRSKTLTRGLYLIRRNRRYISVIVNMKYAGTSQHTADIESLGFNNDGGVEWYDAKVQ